MSRLAAPARGLNERDPNRCHLQIFVVDVDDRRFGWEIRHLGFFVVEAAAESYDNPMRALQAGLAALDALGGFKIAVQ